MITHERKVQGLQMDFQWVLDFLGVGDIDVFSHGVVSFDSQGSSMVLVNGKIGLLDLKFEKIFPSGEMQGSRFGQEPGALFAKIGDVLTGESLEGEGILHGPGHLLYPVDFAQGDDLVEVMAGIHAAFFKLSVVVSGPG